MPLTIDSRRAGEITVLTCAGRIVEGTESTALQQRVNDSIAEAPYVLLHFGGVDFIDSSGLGLLVRCHIRFENLHGLMKICAASSRITEAFRVTGLDTLFRVYDAEADAIAGFFDAPSGQRTAGGGRTILCVEPSSDLLAYMGQVLRQAGYVVMTTTNLPDALTLLAATRPSLVVMGATLQTPRTAGIADALKTRVDPDRVIELPQGFSSQDAADAARELLDRVRTIMGTA